MNPDLLPLRPAGRLEGPSAPRWRPLLAPALVTLAVLACSPGDPGQGPVGRVAGRALYTGIDPDGPVVMAEPLCRDLHDGPVDGGTVEKGPDGGLAHVFVHVLDGLPEDRQRFPPEEPVHLDQQGCFYEPRVLGALVGQTIRVTNRDPTLHTVQVRSPQGQPTLQHAPDDRTARDRALPFEGQSHDLVFLDPGVMVELGCNLHPWTRAWVGVLPHPYFAVTADDGSFELPPLPPGTYTLEAWHEILGRRTARIAVREGVDTTVELSFDPAPQGG